MILKHLKRNQQYQASFNSFAIGIFPGKDSATTKFEMLITKEILAKDIPLIFIDSDKNKIFQLDKGSFRDIIEKYKEELSIFVREYDHVYDY